MFWGTSAIVIWHIHTHPSWNSLNCGTFLVQVLAFVIHSPNPKLAPAIKLIAIVWRPLQLVKRPAIAGFTSIGAALGKAESGQQRDGVDSEMGQEGLFRGEDSSDLGGRMDNTGFRCILKALHGLMWFWAGTAPSRHIEAAKTRRRVRPQMFPSPVRPLAASLSTWDTVGGILAPQYSAAGSLVRIVLSASMKPVSDR